MTKTHLQETMRGKIEGDRRRLMPEDAVDEAAEILQSLGYSGLRVSQNATMVARVREADKKRIAKLEQQLWARTATASQRLATIHQYAQIVERLKADGELIEKADRGMRLGPCDSIDFNAHGEAFSCVFSKKPESSDGHPTLRSALATFAKRDGEG